VILCHHSSLQPSNQVLVISQLYASVVQVCDDQLRNVETAEVLRVKKEMARLVGLPNDGPSAEGVRCTSSELTRSGTCNVNRVKSTRLLKDGAWDVARTNGDEGTFKDRLLR
jgi:hypothetical protein